MVELVDSVDLGSTAKSVQVRVLLPAPNQNNPNLVFPVGDGFGLFRKILLVFSDKEDCCICPKGESQIFF